MTATLPEPMMVTDVDATITHVLEIGERYARTALADALQALLSDVADEVERYGEENDGDADLHAEGESPNFDGENLEELLADAYRAGFAASVEALRERIDAAKWDGFRPAPLT